MWRVKERIQSALVTEAEELGVWLLTGSVVDWSTLWSKELTSGSMKRCVELWILWILEHDGVQIWAYDRTEGFI